MIKITYEEVNSIWKNFERAKQQFGYTINTIEKKEYIDVVCRRLNLVKNNHKKELQEHYKIYKKGGK